jgi:hypothetical protein
VGAAAAGCPGAGGRRRHASALARPAARIISWTEIRHHKRPVRTLVSGVAVDCLWVRFVWVPVIILSGRRREFWPISSRNSPRLSLLLRPRIASD